MKAVLLNGYGGVEQLTFEEYPDPQPSPGEVVVRVISTSVNPIDYKLRSGKMKEWVPLQFPDIPGRDVSGEVIQVGEGVTKFKPGDLVFGLVNHTYASLVRAKADDLSKIPTGLDPSEAGVLPLILQTGAQLMEKGVQPRAGETVLVTGAAGSVGRTAVFVAKQHGATVVAGVRRKQIPEAQSLGADRVVAIDDDRDLGSIPALDAIADTVDGDTIARLLPRLKPSGRLATVVGKPAAARNIDVREVYAKPDPARLYQLGEDFRDGRLKIPIARRLPLSDVREAQRVAESGVEGKVALVP